MKRHIEAHNIIINIANDGDDISVIVKLTGNGIQTEACAAMRDELFERVNETVNWFMIELRNSDLGRR